MIDFTSRHISDEKKQQLRLQMRIEKRLPAADETSFSSEISVADHAQDNPPLIKAEAEKPSSTEGCARTM